MKIGGKMLLSTCCDAPLLNSIPDPICSKCEEHCDYYDEKGEKDD